MGQLDRRGIIGRLAAFLGLSAASSTPSAMEGRDTPTEFLGFGGRDGVLSITVRRDGEDQVIEIDAAEFVRSGRLATVTRPTDFRAILQGSTPYQ